MKRLLFFFILSACLGAKENFSVPQAEVYSEGTYWTNSSIVSNSVFARAFSRFNQIVQPFFQMGVDQTFGFQGRGDLYISPGLHFRKTFFSLFGEHRFHTNTNESLSFHEWRALLVAGDIFGVSLSRSTPVIAFWEPYSELLFSTNQDNNILFQGMSRLGVRYLFSSQTSTDLFLEPYISFLQNTYGENTQVQLRPSARAQMCLDNICLSFIAARFLPIFGDLDPGFRFLATLKGII